MMTSKIALHEQLKSQLNGQSTKVPICAVVMAKNEEARLEGCLRSLGWCQQIVVMDNASSDQTREIALVYTEHVYRYEGANFDAARVEALRYVTQPWVFAFDADERVPPMMARKVAELVASDAADVIIAHLRPLVFGKFLNSAMKHDLRFLFKRSFGTFTADVHATQRVDWEKRPRVVDLPAVPEYAITHLSHPYVAFTVDKTNRFSDSIAAQWYREGRRFSWGGLTIGIARGTLYHLFRQGLVREGRPGIFFGILAAFSETLMHMKLWELESGSIEKYRLILLSEGDGRLTVDKKGG